MANRRPQPGGNGGRRMDFNRNDGRKNFGRSGVSPWQGGGPGAGLPNLLPLGGGSTEATLALASNIINLLQPRPNPVPSLLDMPIRRDFGPQMGRFDRGFVPNRMGNQGNFRRTGNYNRAGERINTNRKQFKPNDGPKQQPKSSPKKEADSKAKPVKESENQEEKKEDGTEQVDVKEEVTKESPKTRYDEINPQLLKCHICNKSMWDGRSFENHLSGRAHAIMMQKTAQSYALTADTMRQEFKIREMKRHRRTGSQPARDFYCAMCDMYAADGALHRTTVGHRKLKKYLHPTCTTCHKEMPTRIELDEHRLTAEHLRNMQDIQEVVTKPKPEVMVISTLSMEQSYLRDDRQRKRRHDKHDDEKETDKEAAENQDGAKTESGNEEDKTKTDNKAEQDTDATILDYKEGDDLSHVTSEMLPEYSTSRGVGASFLSEFRCVQCRLCHKLLDSEHTARVHLRTWKHHQLFVKSLMPQTQASQEAAPKRAHNDDDEGNWKRQKTQSQEQDDNLENGDITLKEEPQTTTAEANEVDDPSNEDLDQLEDWGDDTNAEEIQEEQKEIDGPPKSNVEAPSKEDDYLDNWADEGTVDEILRDERENQEEVKVESVPEPEAAKAEPEVVKPAPATPAVAKNQDNKPRGSPRGRARGRGRGRGRY